MIVPEGHYGWGILAIPIHRGSQRAGDFPSGNWPIPPVSDLVSWRRFSLYCAATCLLLITPLLLYRPATPARPAPPVEVVVRLHEEVHEIPLPAPPVAAPASTERPQEIRKKEMAVTARRKAVVSAPQTHQKRLTTVPPVTLPPPPVEVAATAEIPVLDLPLPPPSSRRPRAAAEISPPTPKRALSSAQPEVALGAQPVIRQRSPGQAAAVSPRPQEKVSMAMGAEIELQPDKIRGKTIRTAETPTIGKETRRAAATVRAPASDLQPPVPPPRPKLATAPAEMTLEPLRPDLPTVGSAPFAFLDQLAPAELDRSLLVSLNRLRTCRDPRAELQLKTRLATLLSRPDLCRSSGVVFNVLYPESAYSVHIDLYNYEQKEFSDRCAALRQAIDCFEARR